jgi:outer membrane protein OmpA-like peptidoglycan-associated protein
MTSNRVKYILGFALVILGLSKVNAQTKRDSSNAEIKQQAIEMREKLNKYMADKLLEEQVKKDPGVQVFFDSISTTLTNQQLEINKLKEQFERLEKQLNDGVYTNGTPKLRQIQDSMIADVARGVAFHRVSDKQLNLYFPFDGFGLTKDQRAELRSFLSSQKAIVVKVNGYTDWMGTEKHNKELAANRCTSIIKVVNGFRIRHKVSTNINCNNNEVYNVQTAKWCRRVEVIIQ